MQVKVFTLSISEPAKRDAESKRAESGMVLKEHSLCGVTFNPSDPKASGCNLPVPQEDIRQKPRALCPFKLCESQGVRPFTQGQGKG